MSRRNKFFFTVVFVLICGVAGYWLTLASNRKSIITASLSEPEPVGKVRVVPLNRGKIQEELTAYGTVVAAVGKTRTFSVPFESQIQEVMVAAGQPVDVNTPMIRLSSSPDARLQLAQARVERDSTQSRLELTREQVDLKLATRQDLAAAQQQFDAAQLNMTSLEEKGIESGKIIRAESAGMVSKIDIEQGQIVPAGSAMIEIIGHDQISVRLGVESENIALLKAGQEVHLFRIHTPGMKRLEGKINLVTHRVNPRTRMVDVFVTPEADGDLLLNEYIEARIPIHSARGFLIPKSALLPEQDSFVVFTVHADRAEKHTVQVGLENPDQVEVFGDTLREGQWVVVEGNYELAENMAVEVGPE